MASWTLSQRPEAEGCWAARAAWHLLEDHRASWEARATTVWHRSTGSRRKSDWREIDTCPNTSNYPFYFFFFFFSFFYFFVSTFIYRYRYRAFLSPSQKKLGYTLLATDTALKRDSLAVHPLCIIALDFSKEKTGLASEGKNDERFLRERFYVKRLLSSKCFTLESENTLGDKRGDSLSTREEKRARERC